MLPRILRPITRARVLPIARRGFHASRHARDDRAGSGVFTNILASDNPPPVQVSSIGESGITVGEGLVISSATIFLEGKVFLWDIPNKRDGWTKERFEIFEVCVPRPEILLFGTGKSVALPPLEIRRYLNDLGIQLDVMDTRNAASTYNLLAEEGRRVAAALLPVYPNQWDKQVLGQ